MSRSTMIVLLRCLQGVTLVGAILLSGLLAYGGFLAGQTGCGDTVTQAHLVTFRCALAMYRVDTGAYPTTEQGLCALLARPERGSEGWRGPYLEAIRRDRWEREFVYRGMGNAYEVLSLGPDGRAGTADDIHSSMIVRRSP